MFRPSRILTINEARQRTSRILPRALYEYIEGGTEDETTLAENENAFRSLTLRPRMVVDVEPDLELLHMGEVEMIPVAAPHHPLARGPVAPPPEKQMIFFCAEALSKSG